MWSFCFWGDNSFASPVLLQVLVGTCSLHPMEVPLLQNVGGIGFERAVSLAGRKVLFLLSLAT